MTAADSPAAFRRVVWPLAVGQTIVWAGLYYVFPALILVWERDLGWSKTELSTAFTGALVVSALMAPVMGHMIDRGHGRRVLVGSAVLGAGLMALLSQVTALWQFLALWAALGVALSGSLYEPCFALLTRTMGAQARRAITRVTLVAGLAGTVSFPSAHALVDLVGWRGTTLVFAAAVLLVSVPLTWYGAGRALAYGARAEPAGPHAHDPRPARHLLATPVFWLLALAFMTLSINHGMLLTHLLPILDDRGVGRDAAVFAASMIGPMQVAGRLAMILAERRLPMLAIARGIYVVTILATVCLWLAGGGSAATGATAGALGLVVAFVVLQGSGWGITSIARPVVVAELMGRTHFGAVSGMLAVSFVGGSAAAPTIAALLRDAGGYDRVITTVMGLAVVGFIALALAARAARARGMG